VGIATDEGDMRKPSRFASKMHAPIDYVIVRTDILDFLERAGPQRTEQVTAEFCGRYGAETIVRALRYLEGDGIINRATTRQPWAILRRQGSSPNLLL